MKLYAAVINAEKSLVMFCGLRCAATYIRKVRPGSDRWPQYVGDRQVGCGHCYTCGCSFAASKTCVDCGGAGCPPFRFLATWQGGRAVRALSVMLGGPLGDEHVHRLEQIGFKYGAAIDGVRAAALAFVRE